MITETTDQPEIIAPWNSTPLGDEPFSAYDHLTRPTAENESFVSPGFDRLRRFLPERETQPLESWEQLRQLKGTLIGEIGHANSLRDYSGWRDNTGQRLIDAAQTIDCRDIQIIDGSNTQSPRPNLTRLQKQSDLQIDLKLADFRNSKLYKSLTPVDVSILFDTILRQDNAVEAIKNVASKTAGSICIAQPVLKEHLFNLPAGCVNLQSYPEDLKSQLRFTIGWQDDPLAQSFDTESWIWGQTASWFESIFNSYGWESASSRHYELSEHWDYALIRFVPKSSN